MRASRECVAIASSAVQASRASASCGPDQQQRPAQQRLRVGGLAETRGGERREGERAIARRRGAHPFLGATRQLAGLVGVDTNRQRTERSATWERPGRRRAQRPRRQQRGARALASRFDRQVPEQRAAHRIGVRERNADERKRPAPPVLRRRDAAGQFRGEEVQDVTEFARHSG